MNSNNPVKSGVNTVMGVKEPTLDTTVRTDLDNPRWDKAVTLKYLGATLAQIAAMTALLWLMDIVLESLNTTTLPQGALTAFVCAFFCFCDPEIASVLPPRQYPQ